MIKILITIPHFLEMFKVLYLWYSYIGPHPNRVFARDGKQTCTSICEQTPYKFCDASLSVTGFMGKAKDSKQEVGWFYSYGCDAVGGGFETQTVDITTITQGYSGYCCCRFAWVDILLYYLLVFYFCSTLKIIDKYDSWNAVYMLLFFGPNISKHLPKGDRGYQSKLWTFFCLSIFWSKFTGQVLG